jgi:hypothetical protein
MIILIAWRTLLFLGNRRIDYGISYTMRRNNDYYDGYHGRGQDVALAA